MRVRVEIGRALVHIDEMQQAALYAASEQALQDCNHYIPARDWYLRDSSDGASDLEQGRLVWQTPYARRRYYEHANISRDKNANATREWADVAKRNHVDDWRRAAEKAMGDV